MTIRELENADSRLALLYDTGDQLKKFIYDCADRMFAEGDKARDAMGSIEALDVRRRFLKEKFIESLGGLPSVDSPLHARTVDRIRCEGYTIEKVIFESRPQAYVTANLYLPDGITSPRGAVLFLCGHHQRAKHEPEYQEVCQYLVRAGLVVLAQDPIGQGERFSYYERSLGATTADWGVYEHDYAGCQSWALGDAIARYFVHVAIRGIHYLCTRPEVDPARIGVTGNSGGGTQTSMMMVCDPRITAAAPATFVMNRKTFMDTGMAQDSEQIWPGMTAYGFDHEDILLAMAPKPVLVLDVSGSGAVSSNRINFAPELDSLGTHFKLSHELMWLGDSLPALRTYDVLWALDMIAGLPGIDRNGIHIYAAGRYGLYGRLAAVLDERVGAVEVRDGLESYAAWIRSRHYDEYDIMSMVIPGVLQYFDMPDIDRWNAEDSDADITR